jgi:hypothetical protein
MPGLLFREEKFGFFAIAAPGYQLLQHLRYLLVIHLPGPGRTSLDARAAKDAPSFMGY